MLTSTSRASTRVDDPIYLDFQATTPLDPAVLDAMLPWLRGAYNAHAEEHCVGRRAAAAVEMARQDVANLLGCEASEVTFTSGATEASNIVLRGLTGPGATIAVSSLEHASVAETADALATNGIFVHRIDATEEGMLDIGHLEALLDRDLVLVSVSAVNNEIGTVQPIAEAASLCAQSRTLLHSDVTQAAGRIPLSLVDSAVSYASMSSHKIYGPQGIGALYIRGGAPKPSPICTGGDQERGLRPGTLPVASCVGFGVACDLALSRREQESNDAQALAQALLEGLSDLDDWHVNGSLEHRIPHNLSIAFEGIDADILLASIPELALSTGSACSSGSLRESLTLRAIGVPNDLACGTIRIGFGRTTTFEHVMTAAAILRGRVTALRSQ